MKKNLIKTIIEELISGERLSSIMLKVQLLASVLENDDFTEWVQNEIDGYNGTQYLPKYRRVKINSLKVYENGNLSCISRSYIIPIHAIVDPTYRIIVSNVYFKDSVSKLEELIATKDLSKTIIKEDVNFPWTTMKTNIDNNYLSYDSGFLVTIIPIIQIHAIEEMIGRIKSNLLTKLIQFYREFDPNIKDIAINNDKNTNFMNTYIYANAIHQGIGNITAIDNKLEVENDKNLSLDIRKQIQELFDQFIKLTKIGNKEKSELVEYLNEIREELNKENASPKKLRKVLRAIKSFGGIVTEKAVELGIDHIISSLPF